MKWKAPFGIMFHHFVGQGHPQGQGSISAEQLDRLLASFSREHILNADDYMDRALHGKLRPGDICLTFDDNLRCQYDVALPVLESYGIKAFWFVYTSVYSGILEKLEVYRYFRTVAFDSIDDFYRSLFEECQKRPFFEEIQRELATFSAEEYLPDFPFYTKADRVFRFVRDGVLGPERYDQVMQAMLERRGFSPEALRGKLWIEEEGLKNLHQKGHIIGLHSHSHPTAFEQMSLDRQFDEYERNLSEIRRITGARPVTMSHPCNSYGAQTLPLLQELGIKFGFRSNLAASRYSSHLEFGREDHANLIREFDL